MHYLEVIEAKTITEYEIYLNYPFYTQLEGLLGFISLVRRSFKGVRQIKERVRSSITLVIGRP